jgi:hypothetical protein
VTEFPPAIRISATYAATDGSTPEDVTVEVPINAMADYQFDVLIDHVVKSLADVPARTRYTSERNFATLRGSVAAEVPRDRV